MIDEIRKKQIIREIKNALDYQFEAYGLQHMIKDISWRGWTEEEIKWAKNSLEIISNIIKVVGD